MRHPVVLGGTYDIRVQETLKQDIIKTPSAFTYAINSIENSQLKTNRFDNLRMSRIF